jgi:hypothetical protein
MGDSHQVFFVKSTTNEFSPAARGDIGLYEIHETTETRNGRKDAGHIRSHQFTENKGKAAENEANRSPIEA